MSSRKIAVVSLVAAACLARIAVAATDEVTAGARGSSSARPRAALSLSQAQERALRYQPSLRQARGQTEAAEGRTEQARSGYLPQASLTGSYQRTTGNFALRPGSTPTQNIRRRRRRRAGRPPPTTS